MTTDDLKEKGRNAAKQVSDIVNYSSGSGTDAFLEQMSREHRTLQQSFTRMCLQWLEQVAERKGPQNVDGRNEASQKIAEKLIGESLPSQQILEQMMDGFIKTIAVQNNVSEDEIRANWDVYKPSKWLPLV